MRQNPTGSFTAIVRAQHAHNRLGINSALIALFLITLTLWMPTGSAAAQSQTPFACSPDFFQVVNNLGSGVPFEGNFNRLYKLDPETGAYALLQSNDIGSYNAISYNVEDNLIYGILGGSNHLMRIGADGVAQDLGSVAGLPSGSIFVGAFDLYGNLYIRRGANMYRIDVGTRSATQVNLSAGGIDRIADFGLSACDNPSTPETEFCFVGVQSGGSDLVFFQLQGPDDNTAQVTTIPLSGDITGETGTFGANYPVANENGELFASNNVSGNVFRILLNYNFSNLANTTAIGAFTAIGAQTNSNDGASCALAASPFLDAVANNDTDTTRIGTPVTTAVIANDSTVPGTTLVLSSLVIVDGPANGVAVANGDGTVTYTPNGGFGGADSYVYEVCNNAVPEVCDTATVAIVVDATNAQPVAAGDSARTAMGSAVVIDVIANDSDPDNDLVASGTVAVELPVHGEVISNNDGSFTYAPSAGYVGPDTFTYEVCDVALACDQAQTVVFVGWEQLQWRTESTYVAYEDLKNAGWSDWDYNDFVVRIDAHIGQNSAGQVAAIEIDYEALARGAGYYHRFFHKLPVQGGGIALMTGRDGDGSLSAEYMRTFDADTSFPIFDVTRDALPPVDGFFDSNTRSSQPGIVAGGTATLTLYLNDATANPMNALPPTPWDPYILVLNTEQEVHLLIPGHLDNTQAVNSESNANNPLAGYDLPLAQSFSAGWQWPVEFAGIWRGYPQYVAHISSGRIDSSDWWSSENAILDWIWGQNGAPASAREASTLNTPESRYFASAVTADLNGDGWTEIIIGDLLKNQVEVIDDRRQPVDGWPQPVGGGVKAAARVADLNGDGLNEVVAGAADGRLYAWHADGTLVDGWPVTVNADFRVLATAAVGDIDGDGVQDVVVPATDGKLHAFDAFGVAKPGWPVSIGDVEDLYGGQVINSSPQLADLDGNGVLEIVIGSTDHQIYAFDASGAVRWTYATEDLILSTPAVGDIVPDIPGLETAVGSGDGYVYLLNESGALVWKQATGWTVRSSPTIADMDGDQTLEIIVGSDDDKVWAWHNDGQPVAGWPQDTGADVFSSVQVGDVDGDDQPEIVVGSDSANVYAWSMDGSIVEGWPRSTNSSVKGAPALANLDSDPELEIVAGDLSGSLFIWNDSPLVVDNWVFMPIVAASE